ncbi:MAG: helix-turn-helix transcriptional regulator [Clostridiales Family XIII bacterium]|jgi:DNA-binding Xre family transcriptional regulator|nr:helix-turn-helix transcriptional regulator [Clostridiales Family XIII bacterium]
MSVSYKKLWKLLIDKDMKKKDLMEAADISWQTITKLNKGNNVGVAILEKICSVLKCDIGDIAEMIPDKESSTQNSSVEGNV